MKPFQFSNAEIYDKSIIIAIKDMIQNYSDIDSSNYIFKTIEPVEHGFNVNLIASSIEYDIFVSHHDISRYHLIKTVDMGDYLYRLGGEFDDFVSDTTYNLFQKQDK